MFAKWRIALQALPLLLVAVCGICQESVVSPELVAVNPALGVFHDPSAGYEEKLEFILEHSEEIIDALRLYDSTRLATDIGDAVALAPFSKNREVAFMAVLKIAESALDHSQLATAPDVVLLMPIRSLLLQRGAAVKPSYGQAELASFLLKYSRHPVSKVRLVVMRELFGIWDIDLSTKDKLREFLDQQVTIELEFQGETDLETVIYQENLGVAVQLRDVFSMPGRRSPPVISDVEFQKLLKMPRQELLALALKGDYFAWELIRLGPFTSEEELILLNTIGEGSVGEPELQILQRLLYLGGGDDPIHFQQVRIDRILAWFRAELTRVDLNPYPFVHRRYVSLLSGLAMKEVKRDEISVGRRRRSGGAEPDAHAALSQTQGRSVIELLTLLAENPDEKTRASADEAMAKLRAVYEPATVE